MRGPDPSSTSVASGAPGSPPRRCGPDEPRDGPSATCRPADGRPTPRRWWPSWSPGTRARGSKRPWPPWRAQDYEELSVLVLVSGGSDDPTRPGGAVLPEAFVRRLDEDHGFGAAANEVSAMVEGAAFFLLVPRRLRPRPRRRPRAGGGVLPVQRRGGRRPRWSAGTTRPSCCTWA